MPRPVHKLIRAPKCPRNGFRGADGFLRSITRGAQPGLFPILRFLSQTALRLLILHRFGLFLLFSYLLFLHLALIFLPTFVSHGGSFPCAIYQ